MKVEDFIEVDNEKYLDFVNKIIENNGRCDVSTIGYGCENCPFDESNNPKGIHCAQSGLTNEYIDENEEDQVMLESAVKFKELYLIGV